jgi:putative FmdB family regulatory protein
MPTYEYACGACAHQWEEVQRITENPIEVCPKCGKPAAHRLISAGTNFILKGGGWYSDLYSSPKQSGSGDKPTDAKAPEKTEAKGATSEAKSGTDSSSSTASKPAAESAPAAPKTPSPAASS